ncbi:hypothetical protein PYW07_005489 [Mythimna separata]|uniref:C2H2-type domain-containing protein n=1 Tax=Mythimna separata TaxID=271217 RepID=A0AAD7YIZ6_MYTSE|nr:hypothetical protein PYW07_005489 [Mythimna separata]
MDLKDDEKSRNWCERPHHSYYETNAGQLFVNNVNPFDTVVGGNAGDVSENLPNKLKNDELINIFDNNPNKQTNEMPSKVLNNEKLKNYALRNSYNEHKYLKEQLDDDLVHHGGQHRAGARPAVSMSANTFNTQYSFCTSDIFNTSRYDYEWQFDNNYDQDNNRYQASSSNETMNDQIAADENEQFDNNTYCQPSTNMCNQDVLYKTMLRNAKLQKVVRKLVIERERLKQREAWNNYINDLKNKHRYYSNEPSRILPQYVPGDHNTPEMIDDFSNARHNWRHSHPYQQFLEDIYGAPNYSPSTTNTRYPPDYDSREPPEPGSFIYNNDRFCYPSCSQASMLRLNKERPHYTYNLRPRLSGRCFHGNSAAVDTNRARGFDSIHGKARPYFSVPTHARKPRGASAPIQSANLPLVDEEDYKDLNVSKVEVFQDGNNIYFPYCSDEKPRAQEETLEQEQYILVPLKHKSVKTYMHAGVSFTQELSKLDKQVNVPSKHASLRNSKDNHNKLKAFTNNKDCNIQRPLQKYEFNNEIVRQKKENFKENFKKVSENITKLKAKIRQSEEDTKIKSLANIEEKIDCLMKSMNSIMSDFQAKKNTLLSKRSTAVSACKIVTSSRNVLNRHNSDPYNYKNIDYVVQESSRSLTISEVVSNELRRTTDSSISNMEDILIEEMEKSDKAKSDIEEILNLPHSRSCSLQITFDIPTKETSTEVTDSLSKDRCKYDNKPVSGKISSSDRRGMTIAVNTDPLGLLALLRVSTETVKQILSYMPNLNYQTYLSLLPLLLPIKLPRCVQHYTCNICGASFSQPSQLSAHVKQHNMGKTRDCCVCHHTLDSKCARTGTALFRCRYCGQRFTRAYCCELHQKSCARQLGRCHDVTSSHLLLQ